MAYQASRHVDSIDVNSTGKRILLGLSSLEGNIWDGGVSIISNEGNELCSRQLPSGVSKARFLGSQLVIAARDDGKISLLSSDKLEDLQIFSAHDDIVSCVVSDPNNESEFLSCSWDGSIHLWDWRIYPQCHSPLRSYNLAHYGHINEVAYSNTNSNIFGSCGYDGFVRLWDKREKSTTNCSSIINIGQICSSMSFISTASGNLLLVGTDAGEVSIVDIRQGTMGGVASSDDDSYLNSHSAVSTTKIHSGRVRRILPLKSNVKPPPPGIGSLSVNADDDNGLFMTASDDTTYAIYRINDSVDGVEECKRYVKYQ